MPTKKKIKIVIVDDSIEFSSGLAFFLGLNGKFEVIDCVHNGKELLSSNIAKYADVILVDLVMPEMDGFDTAKIFNYNFPHTKLIAISMHEEKAVLHRLIECGFKGFVHKNNVFDSIILAIETVMSGSMFFTEEVTEK